MSVTCRIPRCGIGRRVASLLASAAALLLSALLTAMALQVPDLQWLGCLSFLPLFAIIRRLRPSAASLVGCFWGSCLYLFCLISPPPAIDALPFTNHLTSSADGLSVYAGGQAGSSAWLLEGETLEIIADVEVLPDDRTHYQGAEIRLTVLVVARPLLEAVPVPVDLALHLGRPLVDSPLSRPVFPCSLLAIDRPDFDQMEFSGWTVGSATQKPYLFFPHIPAQLLHILFA